MENECLLEEQIVSLYVASLRYAQDHVLLFLVELHLYLSDLGLARS